MSDFEAHQGLAHEYGVTRPDGEGTVFVAAMKDGEPTILNANFKMDDAAVERSVADVNWFHGILVELMGSLRTAAVAEGYEV